MNPSREERVAAARARMAELREKFVERTRGELATMRAGMAALEAGDASALDDLLQLSHRMTGTGATLGFDALSAHAHQVERLAEAHAPGTLPDADARSRLRAAIDALAAELARTRSAG
jgi:chemotaxis protein histidine kinase CheA